MSTRSKQGSRDSSLHPTVVALAVVSLLHDLAGDMVTPLLPALLATMGSGPAVLGLIEGIADATTSLLKLASGYFADRIGRLKALTIAGYGVANLLRPMLALASTWWQVLAIRFGDRLGKGLRGSPRDALIAAVTPKETRGHAFGFHHALESLGAVFGTILGYLLLTVGLSVRQVIAWSVVPGVLTMAVVIFRNQRPTGDFKAGQGRGWAGAGERIQAPPDCDRNVHAGKLLRCLPPVACSGGRRPRLSHSDPLGGASCDALRDRNLGREAQRSRPADRSAITAGWLVYAASYAGFALCSHTWHIWALFAVCRFPCLVRPDRRALKEKRYEVVEHGST